MGLIVEFTSAATDPMRNGNVEHYEATVEVLEPASDADLSAAAPSGTTVIDLFADGADYWFEIGLTPTAEEGTRFIKEGERRQFDATAGLKVSAAVV